MELPSYARDAVLIEYTGYCVCYNADARLPFWVAYELTGAEVDAAVADKKGKGFRRDPRVELPQADWYDYKGSGWSRGHMAPAADFKWSEDALWDTFYYTNCCPQNRWMNNGPWNVLENQVRRWAKAWGNVYVVTGPVLKDRQFGTLGPDEVVIPVAFFKALLVQNGDGYHAIGFVMDNTDAPQTLQESYMTVDALEALTGYDFFPALPNRVERQVEAAVDVDFWKMN